MSWFKNLSETSVLQPALQPSLVPQVTDYNAAQFNSSSWGGFSNPCSSAFSSFSSPFGR
jgi:hypothetical protein